MAITNVSYSMTTDTTDSQFFGYNNFLPNSNTQEKFPFYENGCNSLAFDIKINNYAKKDNKTIITRVSLHYPDCNYFLKGNSLIGINTENEKSSILLIPNNNKKTTSPNNQSENPILCYEKTLNNSRKYLGLNISMIAVILKLSRPTIYSYLKGKEPNESHVDSKIIELNKTIDIVKDDFGFHSFSSLFKRRDKNGKTLSDYYMEDNKNLEHFVIALCIEEKDRRSKFKKTTSTKKVNNELFSVPVYKE
jgi:hypothetical protein